MIHDNQDENQDFNVKILKDKLDNSEFVLRYYFRLCFRNFNPPKFSIIPPFLPLLYLVMCFNKQERMFPNV